VKHTENLSVLELIRCWIAAELLYRLFDIIPSHPSMQPTHEALLAASRQFARALYTDAT